MAKDYMLTDDEMLRFERRYFWYRKKGAKPDWAFNETLEVVRNWKIPRLLRHKKHGLCGGNADQALAAMEEFFDGMEPRFRKANP